METWLLRTSTCDDDASKSERARFLTLEGRRIVRALGNKIKMTEEPIFDRVLASPDAASVQTAELFADRVDYVGVVEVMPELETGVPPQVAAPLLLARGERVLVVTAEVQVLVVLAGVVLLPDRAVVARAVGLGDGVVQRPLEGRRPGGVGVGVLVGVARVPLVAELDWSGD